MHELAAWHIGISIMYMIIGNFLEIIMPTMMKNGSNFLNTYSLNRIYLIFF